MRGADVPWPVCRPPVLRRAPGRPPEDRWIDLVGKAAPPGCRTLPGADEHDQRRVSSRAERKRPSSCTASARRTTRLSSAGTAGHRPWHARVAKCRDPFPITRESGQFDHQRGRFGHRGPRIRGRRSGLAHCQMLQTAPTRMAATTISEGMRRMRRSKLPGPCSARARGSDRVHTCVWTGQRSSSSCSGSRRKVRRWCSQGPISRMASRWSGVGSPCSPPSWYAGPLVQPGHQFVPVVLARMEAAAMLRKRPSPFTRQ